jgi:hypothetical protein
MSDSVTEYLPAPETMPTGNAEFNVTDAGTSLRAGEFDPLANGSAAEVDAASNVKLTTPSLAKSCSLIKFYSPSELKAYEPPPNQNMIGDYHLQRGSPSVLAGPPGCGKSRAALALGRGLVRNEDSRPVPHLDFAK